MVTRSTFTTGIAVRFTLRLLSTSSLNEAQTVSTLTDEGILTVRMNRPKTLNAWTQGMMQNLQSQFERANNDDKVKVMILTGTGKYYCAGVELKSMIKPMHPKKLHDLIRRKNQQLFDMFLDMKKPVIAAVNGPAIGASVTSAVLCDAIVASESATFSTPFARLGVPPEGCSSVHFERIFGQQNADRMMGPEAWVPTAKEAVALGFVHSVADDEDLLKTSHDLAREWIQTGKQREIGPLKGGPDITAEYKLVNAKESIDLADAFLGDDFLEGQRAFLSSKGKTGPAMVFSILKLTRPIWGMLLPSKGTGS